MVGRNGWCLVRVQIPVSPGLRSVLIGVLQGACFLASYLNPPQMEMVGGSWPGEPTARRRLECNVRMCSFLGRTIRQALEEIQNLTLPRAVFPSVSQEKLGLGWILDSGFPVQAGPQAYSVTLRESVHLPGT